MRRKDKQITDPKQMEAILQSVQCLRLGLVDNGLAYIVPMSFGLAHENGSLCLYFHSAPEGKKIDLIRQSSVISFEADADIALIEAETAAEFSSSYQCVMGQGRIEILEEEDAKRHALQVIMAHYTGKEDWTLESATMKRLVCLRLTVDAMTGKANKA